MAEGGADVLEHGPGRLRRRRVAAVIQVLSRKAGGSGAVNGTLQFHRFSVAEYHQMIDAGILTTNHKVELLDGWIVDKMTQNPPHVTVVTRLTRWLASILPEDEWTLRVQGPITLSTSEPEPDVVLARGPDSSYEKRHPGPKDVALLIEV